MSHDPIRTILRQSMPQGSTATDAWAGLEDVLDDLMAEGIRRDREMLRRQRDRLSYAQLIEARRLGIIPR